MARQRLDVVLVGRGLASTREQARGLIMGGAVRVEGRPASKPGLLVHEQSGIEVAATPRFVGRGGLKLERALDAFGIEVSGCAALDVGASTGGFTDCALQAGAADVICVDVGRAQLHAKLLADPRVTNFEKMNARHLSVGDLPRSEFDTVVTDLSFISLKVVLPAIWPFVRPGGALIALVKPQFEAGKAEVDKGRGVIRDPAVQQAVLDDIRTFAIGLLRGATLIGTIDSPITGTDGNREFLLGLRRSS